MSLSFSGFALLLLFLLQQRRLFCLFRLLYLLRILRVLLIFARPGACLLYSHRRLHCLPATPNVDTRNLFVGPPVLLGKQINLREDGVDAG